ncbi:MAG TPA: ISNCY family transposase [Nitrospira sp.]|nr:ISNCY family transposase [Nitrospira sp.]
MVREDRVTMSAKELRRVHVIRQVVDKQLTQVHAGGLLGLTPRQVRRLVRRVEQEGAQGLVHRGRGKASNRRIPEKKKAEALRLYAQRYGDFGPTLAVEQLAARHQLAISAETLRTWLLAEGVDHFRRRKRPHRAWRARKAHRGELVQLDGSHHDWLEGRGPQCVLMAYIDDASSVVFAQFYEYEGTIPAMDSFRRYVLRYGVPLAIYADKHTTYRSPAEPTIEEQLAGAEPASQFGRALQELGVELIAAHSPQAKGRVERLFKTFQDRLVKELRLARIATLEAANRFLEDYLPIYNHRFAVRPAQAADLHRPRLPRRDLDHILCIKTNRVLRRDWTVTHNGQLYQIHDNVRPTHVMVEERLDGTLRLTHHGRALTFHAIAAPPQKPREADTPGSSPRRGMKPRPDHPWRKRLLPEQGPCVAAATS